ncbi:hypothetical protein RQM47_15065 [Rubrivirga sp. S365]|uniref:Uncharacterized protein n=1 Tax=Rubrivirga litoralis TaxID=3075598 RepID=A0ABU3BRJ3_9BACT|nr:MULTISPECIES: hypothetical protein [unclassified Rubrivirga]MDT0631912.1 hypothetical protein [Rubrivirga sp. F394]MDT7857965.1 hypothetical protein [Rubrivirga sp. S365]
MRPWAAAALVALAGCGGAAGGVAPAVDSTLVDALADVALADARAALADTTGGAGRAPSPGGAADSLRAVALAAHGLDDAALDRALDRLARDPALAEATYAAVAQRLRDERWGTSGPAPDP